MKFTTAVLTLGVVLITQWNYFVSCQDEPSEQTIKDFLSKYDDCPNGYCIPIHLCKDGYIINDGKGILDESYSDDDTATVIELERGNRSCDFSTTCCAWKNEHRTEKGTSIPNELPPPRCGINRPDGFVVKVQNSGTAQFAEFPWMAALLQRVEHQVRYFCGGSLIHPKVILTAAHCVKYVALDTIVVRLGEWDTVTVNEPVKHQEYGVRKMVIHEDYYELKLHNDIALLIMEEEAELKVNVNTICLPSTHDVFDDQRCIASGWGKAHFAPEGKYSEVMKKVELPVIPRERCQLLLRATRLGPHFQLHPSFMCGGGEEAVDTSKGDGGSPLACKMGDQFIQAGIVSWGIDNGAKNVPAAYVKVSKFVGWIEDHLGREGINITGD